MFEILGKSYCCVQTDSSMVPGHNSNPDLRTRKLSQKEPRVLHGLQVALQPQYMYAVQQRQNPEQADAYSTRSSAPVTQHTQTARLSTAMGTSLTHIPVDIPNDNKSLCSWNYRCVGPELLHDPPSRPIARLLLLDCCRRVKRASCEQVLETGGGLRLCDQGDCLGRPQPRGGAD